jgi:hypothetical protein
MQASIKMKTDGSVAMQLDVEAARFHERIALLVKVAKEGLQLDGRKSARRLQPCQ